MAFKMKGSAFKLNNVATKSALKQITDEERTANLAYTAKPKWWKNEDGTANVALLNERGFTWDDVEGRWTDEKGGKPYSWVEGWDPRGDQRRNVISTDLAEEGKEFLLKKNNTEKNKNICLSNCVNQILREKLEYLYVPRKDIELILQIKITT